MDPPITTAHRTTAVLWGVSAAATVAALGPALRSGVVVSYDLAWPASARLTPFALGVGTPAPRAVPSDAVAVLLGGVLGPGPAQKLVLFGMLMMAGVATGRLAQRLIPAASSGALAAAAVAAIWNPFVEERLVVGQWTILWGYAAAPILVRVALEVRAGRRSSGFLAAGVAWCGLGGANTVVMAGFAVLPVLVLSPARWRAAVGVLGTAVAAGAVWALPALTHRVGTVGLAADAFGPRADTPLGVFGSLLSGGGMWNPAAHPAARESWVVALAAAGWAIAAAASVVLAARRRPGSGVAALLVAGTVGLGLCVLSAVDPGGVWTWLITAMPGGGLLRDTHKLLAPWLIVLAVGTAQLAQLALARRAVGSALAVGIAMVPLVVSPGLTWGVGGRVAAVTVADDLLATSAWLSSQPEQVVGLLPWSQYRRYPWNDHRVSLTVVPRLTDQRILYDDSLPLSTGSIPGEDPVAQSVTAAISAGAEPLAALADVGVRRVVVERASDQTLDRVLGAPPTGWTVVREAPTIVVLDRADSAAVGRPPMLDPGRRPTGTLAVGWFVTVATIALGALFLLGRAVAGKWPAWSTHLLRSAP